MYCTSEQLFCVSVSLSPSKYVESVGIVVIFLSVSVCACARLCAHILADESQQRSRKPVIPDTLQVAWRSSSVVFHSPNCSGSGGPLKSSGGE